MKKYKMLTATTPEEAEDLMNRAAKKGWSVLAVTSYTVCFNAFAITIEKEVPDPQEDPFASVRKD